MSELWYLAGVVRLASRLCCSSRFAFVSISGSSKTTTTTAALRSLARRMLASTSTYSAKRSTDDGICISSTLPSTVATTSSRVRPQPSVASSTVAYREKAPGYLLRSIAFTPLSPFAARPIADAFAPWVRDDAHARLAHALADQVRIVAPALKTAHCHNSR